MHIKHLLSFRKFVILTIVLVYLVVLAGAIVRATGSGMGCPDWPKCFGTWIPPTHVSKLPPDYKEKFKVANHVIADFNPVKTWIEYINRLLGVIVGLSVFATFLSSLRLLTFDIKFASFSFLVLLLTGFQGWIGAKVVSTNLSKYMISIHMLFAILILSLLLYLLYKSGSMQSFKHSSQELLNNLLFATALITLVQILIGTQVRQEIDTLSIFHQEKNRDLWISSLGSIFSLHRVFAIITVLFNGFIVYLSISKLGSFSTITRLVLITTSLIISEYLVGVIMARYALPFLSQPFHLFIATIIFGVQFYTWLLISTSKNQIQQSYKAVS